MGKGDNRRPGKVAINCQPGQHAMPDKWGRCWRCGDKIAEARVERTPDRVISGGKDGGEAIFVEVGESGHRSVKIDRLAVR